MALVPAPRVVLEKDSALRIRRIKFARPTESAVADIELVLDQARGSFREIAQEKTPQGRSAQGFARSKGKRGNS